MNRRNFLAAMFAAPAYTLLPRLPEAATPDPGPLFDPAGLSAMQAWATQKAIRIAQVQIRVASEVADLARRTAGDSLAFAVHGLAITRAGYDETMTIAAEMPPGESPRHRVLDLGGAAIRVGRKARTP